MNVSIGATEATIGLTLRDRVLRLRDRLLASERFQRVATAFPPTRLIARRRARALFDIVAGFAYSQTLRACVALDLFEILAERPRSLDELATRFDLRADAVRTLLDAAASLELVERRRGGRYGLGPLGASLRGAPGVAEMIVHHDMFYADLVDPLALLRGGARETRLGAFWAYARGRSIHDLSPAEVRDYTALMSASQRMVSAEILAAYSFAAHRRLLDVGGGDGTFATAVAARRPELAISMCDLAPVATLARDKLAARGLQERISVFDRDFRTEPLPRGADVVTLVRVLHDHDDDVAAALLDSVRRSLPPGGTLVIAEPMAETRGAEPVGDAYFGLYLWAMGSGRPRRPDEIAAMLSRAGFVRIRSVATRTPLIAGVIVARVPESA